jgi:hypothetical protein
VNTQGDIVFDELVRLAYATGLTVQTITQEEKVPEKKPILQTYARLCFDSVLRDRALAEIKKRNPTALKDPLLSSRGHSPICTNKWTGPAATKKGTPIPIPEWIELELTGAPFGMMKYEIVTRSTFGIYRFLGRILAANSMNELELASAKPSEDSRMLAIDSEVSPSGCFVDIGFAGEFYCVPERGAENTKRIFSLLAQLIALKTQPTDLAITPTVRVIP